MAEHEELTPVETPEGLKQPGRIQKAPENFLTPTEIESVTQGRRNFLRGSLFAAVAAMTGRHAFAQGSDAVNAASGDPYILQPQTWATTLGKGVATAPYGLPSKYEADVIRRQSPGLTQTTQSSVSFSPLQSMFGIITASGLHFERHHQGWYDIDPTQHRLMVNGSSPEFVKKPKVYTMDDIMRMPFVSRIHFIETL